MSLAEVCPLLAFSFIAVGIRLLNTENVLALNFVTNSNNGNFQIEEKTKIQTYTAVDEYYDEEDDGGTTVATFVKVGIWIHSPLKHSSDVKVKIKIWTLAISVLT